MKLQWQMTAIGMAGLAGIAMAHPVDGWYRDVDRCDNHGMLRAVEEIGLAPPFEPDEWITAISFQTERVACPGSDGTLPNWVVEMTNMTDRSFRDLFYVGDWTETVFSNEDGEAADATEPDLYYRAFKIDSVGLNRPLYYESIAYNDVFEPGETWRFIIDDYSHLTGLPPHLLASLGFAGASSGFAGHDTPTMSTGSIVMFVPSPGTLGLLGLGALAGARRRR